MISPIAIRRLVLAGIAVALLLAIVLGVFHRDIDADTAKGIANRMVIQYSRGSGSTGRDFGGREIAVWADGWEFRWRYRPCPELASLRIWISRDGRRASYAELPDCAPNGGISVRPLTV